MKPRRPLDPRVALEIEQRKTAYANAFGGRPGVESVVMQDLSKFCREKESTFHADPRVHAVLEGRREVILRIREWLETPLEILCQKHGE